MHKRSRQAKGDNVRRWVEERYALDSVSGVYWRPGTESLAYSDGDAMEDALLAAVQRAKDCSVLSDELRAAITDWPTEYHLSAARANLLRHLPIRAGDSVLELGAGCGALTRYLGETGANVIAVEGSRRRATIARARCRDLSNVVVVCDEIENIAGLRVDWVLLVGVLEYANVFGTGDGDGLASRLAQARKLVADSGALVVAIENQLGLKYFNGCAEDHLGIPYFGIADLYRARGPVTLGRGELDARLANAGFTWREFYFPFPDYKLPLVVLARRGLEATELDVADLVSRASSRDYGGSTLRAFSEALAWSPLIRNGLIAEHANSFLIVAGASETARRRAPGDALAWSYSKARPSRYLVATIIANSPSGLIVRKTPLRTSPQDEGEFTQRIEDAPYLPGRLLSLEMLRHAEAGDVEALLQSALPWLDLLLAAASTAAATARAENASGEDLPQLLLPPDYVDAIPGNVLVDAHGDARVFDLEWRCSTPIAFEWVLLRGLALALLGIVNSPLRGTISVVQLAERLLALRATKLSPRAAETCEAWETRFYTVAVAGAAPIASPLPAQRLTSPFSGSHDGMAPTIANMGAELLRERTEHARLAADGEILRQMFASERAGHEASIAKLRNIDATAHVSISALQQEIEALRQALAAEQGMHAQNIEELRVALAAEQDMHAQNIQKLREVDARWNDAAGEVVRLQDSEAARIKAEVEIVDLRAALEQSRSEYATIEARAGEREAALALATDELRATANAHAEVSTRLQHSEAARTEAAGEIAVLRTTLEHSRDERREVDRVLAATRSELTSSAGELALAKARIEAQEIEREATRAKAAGEMTNLRAAIELSANKCAELDRALAAMRSELAATGSELALARARINAQFTELASLYQERSTVGAKIGRVITRQRNRWFPVDTGRGRAVTLANRFAAAVANEGPASAMRQAGRFVRKRAPLPASIKGMLGADAKSRGPLIGGGTATPPELAQWIAANEPDESQLAEQRRIAQALHHRPLISFIVPVHNVPTRILQAALESLQAQTYDHWEACLACAEDGDIENWHLLTDCATGDSRLRPIRLPKNHGISGNSNLALANARGEFVALLDHDDVLSPSALFAIVVQLNAEPELDFLYTDKDSIDESGEHRQNALFKPAFSPEMLHSVNYLTHLNVMRRSLVEAIGGWRPDTDGAQDWDLFFRFTERTSKIARVPGLHYHWRIISTSTATGLAAKPYAATAQLRCQRDRLERLGWDATAHPDDECGFRILWASPKQENIEIVVHARGGTALRNCLDSLRFARLDDVAAIRVMAEPACPDYADTARDFAQVWGTRVSFVQDAMALSHQLIALAQTPGPPFIVLVDARIHYIGPNAIEDLARWVSGAAPIAWAAAVALAPGDVVLEAGRVSCEDGNSAPLFRHVPLRTWGWFGGPLWHRNASAASPILFALRRDDLARTEPAIDHESFSRWWMRACFAWRGKDRRGVIVPYARAWLDGDFEDATVEFDERFRQDPYFHPAFCNVSPLRLTP